MPLKVIAEKPEWLPDQRMVKNTLRALCNRGLEGMVSKRSNSRYRSGTSRDWIKVKNPRSTARWIKAGFQ